LRAVVVGVSVVAMGKAAPSAQILVVSVSSIRHARTPVCTPPAPHGYTARTVST
jgi:hypothetical protein